MLENKNEAASYLDRTVDESVNQQIPITAKSNNNLKHAKKAKNDEFYTQLSDINIERDLQNSTNQSNYPQSDAEKKDADIAQKAGRSGYRSLNLMPAHAYYPESRYCPKIFRLAR